MSGQSLAALSGLEVTKGHGTRNDFVMLADPLGHLDLTDAQVRALCDRRDGVGGDGLIRAVLRDGTWFMDYRNADGSPAEMCGNGARVFAEFLVVRGLTERPAAGQWLDIATRGGLRRVRSDPRGWAVDMGPATFPGGQGALDAGSDVTVAFAGLGQLPGLRVDMPNPHTVVALRTPAEVHAVDLSAPPSLDPAPPQGSNVELVAIVDAAPPRVMMRVWERGVGETPSCGTGTCAAVAAVLAWAGPDAEEHAHQEWEVIVPGGVVGVTPGESYILAGPAELVYTATLGVTGR